MPYFLPPDEVVFHAIEGGSTFAFRVREDGTEKRKVTSSQIWQVVGVSPDSKFVFGDGPKNPHDGMPGHAGELLPTHRKVSRETPDPTPKPAASGPSAVSPVDPQLVAERWSPGPSRPSLRAIINANVGN